MLHSLTELRYHHLWEGLFLSYVLQAALCFSRFITPGTDDGYDHIFPGDITKDAIEQQKASKAELQEEDLSMMTSSSPLTSNSLAQNADIHAIGKGKEGGGSDRYSSLAMSSAIQGAFWDIDGGGASVKGSPKKEKILTPSPPRVLGERRPTPGRPMGEIILYKMGYRFCSLFPSTYQTLILGMMQIEPQE